MDEKNLTRALAYDFSAGTDMYRDALLERSLAVLGCESMSELSDDELNFLAAAGDTSTMINDTFRNDHIS